MSDSEVDTSASDGVTGEAERGQKQMETLVSADLLSVAEALQFSEHALVQTLNAHRLHTTARNRQTQPEMSHNTAVPTGTPEEQVKMLQISAHETQTKGDQCSSPERKHCAGVEVSGQVCGLQQLLHLSERDRFMKMNHVLWASVHSNTPEAVLWIPLYKIIQTRAVRFVYYDMITVF